MNSMRLAASLAFAVLATIGGYYATPLINGTTAQAAMVSNANSNAVDSLWSASLQNAVGTSQKIAAFKGKPVVINFWASWCGPCVKEMPALSSMNRDYAKRGITFIGVGVDSEKNVNAFLQKVPVDYPVYIAGFGGADLARNFGNNAGALPFTVVIDAKGAIRLTKLGEVDQKELKATLDSL